MNNNQDNFNINPQITNMNNQNPNPTPVSQSRFFQNVNQPVNVMSDSIPLNNQNNLNQAFNQQINNPQPSNISQPAYIQNQNNFNNQFNNINNHVNNFNEPAVNSGSTEDEFMLNQLQNRFINNNVNMENTALNDLNVDGAYNNMPKVDYSQDPKVQENIKKKNTITITSEGKVFILIIVVLLLFIFVMPYIFDTIRNIRY